MIAKSLGWWAMTSLALTVASYAVGLLLVPELRSPFVRTLFAERPVATIAHLAGSAVTLPIGMLQFNRRLRMRFMRMHRGLGRLYVLGVALGGLAGFCLALHSSGGPVAQMGFCLLAVCWLSTTFNAYRHIRTGNRHAHRRWMLRSVALTFAAVTLRLYVPISQIAGIPVAVAYPAIAWLAWIPNLAMAELFIRLTCRVSPDVSFKTNSLGGSA